MVWEWHEAPVSTWGRTGGFGGHLPWFTRAGTHGWWGRVLALAQAVQEACSCPCPYPRLQSLPRERICLPRIPERGRTLQSLRGVQPGRTVGTHFGRGAAISRAVSTDSCFTALMFPKFPFLPIIADILAEFRRSSEQGYFFFQLPPPCQI